MKIAKLKKVPYLMRLIRDVITQIYRRIHLHHLQVPHLTIKDKTVTNCPSFQRAHLGLKSMNTKVPLKIIDLITMIFSLVSLRLEKMRLQSIKSLELRLSKKNQFQKKNLMNFKSTLMTLSMYLILLKSCKLKFRN